MATNDPFAAARAAERDYQIQTTPGANPYPPGSEEADWFDQQLAGNKTGLVAPRSAPNPFAGIPGAETLTPAAKPRPVFHGAIVPASTDSSGKTYFDPFNAGPIGALRHGASYVRDVGTGKERIPYSFENAPPGESSRAMGGVLGLAGFGLSLPPTARTFPRTPSGTRVPNDPSLAEPLSGAELRQKGGDQRAALEGLPVQYDPHYIGNLWATKLEQLAVDNGASRTNSRQLFNEIDTLRRHIPNSADPTATIQATPRSLLQFRDNVTELYGKTKSTSVKDATEHYKGVQAVHKAIDDFIGGGAPPEAYAPGANPRLVAAIPHLFENYRGNYGPGAADRELGNIQSEADVLGRFKGTDPSDTVRNRIASTIIEAQSGRPLTQAMDEQLNQIANQSVPRAIVGSVGRGLSSYGGGVGYALGGAAGHFMGAGDLGWMMAPAVPVIGKGMAQWAGNTAPMALEEARRTLRQQAPVQEDVVAGIGYPRPDITSPMPSGTTALSTAQNYMLTHPQGVPLSADETDLRLPQVPTSY